MSFKCGIVGLPNVGKSTLFNALTRSRAAAAENYPFCTIDPNIGMVEVPDTRLTRLAEMVAPQKIIPAAIEFVDIAGLVAGASKGEGLGNRFLAHIREVDAIAHVVRAFADDAVTHVSPQPQPADDIDTINTELQLADMESADRALRRAEKNSKAGDRSALAQRDLLAAVKQHLDRGQPLRAMALDPEQRRILKPYGFLTAKPMLYIANVGENGADSGGNGADSGENSAAAATAGNAPNSGENSAAAATAGNAPNSGGNDADSSGNPTPADNPWLRDIEKIATAADTQAIAVCAAIEQDLGELEAAEAAQFLADLFPPGVMREAGLARIIRAGYSLLGLHTFFTAGPKEVRAWTVRVGATAAQAAGVIHGDFEKGFIRAETIAYADYLQYGGETPAREAGRLRLEGRDYLVADGDVMHFRFNV